MKKKEIHEELAALIRRESALCIGHEGSELSQARDMLKKKYLGHGYTADAERAERGFSTYVDRTVMESVEWAKPGLMRVFCGEDIIRFDPRTPAQEAAAEQATLYVNHVAFGRNMFSIVHDVLADGLYQRAGWCLAHCPEVEKRSVRRWVGLDEAEAHALVTALEAEGLDVRVVRRKPRGGEAPKEAAEGRGRKSAGAVLGSRAGTTAGAGAGAGVKTGSGAGVNFQSGALGGAGFQSGAGAKSVPGAGSQSGALGGVGNAAGAGSKGGAGATSAFHAGGADSAAGVGVAGTAVPLTGRTAVPAINGASGTVSRTESAGAVGCSHVSGNSGAIVGTSGAGGATVPGGVCAQPAAGLTSVSALFSSQEGEAQGGQAGDVFDVTAQRVRRVRELRLEPVPAEQVVLSGDARDVENARFVAHWNIRTASDLRREGYGDDIIDSLPQASELCPMPETRTGRRVSGWQAGASFGGAGRGADEASRRYRIWEGWLDFDADGDGIAEKLKVVWCGDASSCVVLDWEEWPLYRAPLFAACSVPLPHQAVGLCVADLVCDVQDLRTEMTRQYLDSLALANQGELVVNEGQMGGGVEYDSLLARGVGAVHRIRGDASISPLPVSTSSGEALKGLEMSDGLVERRTGISSRTQSLGADSLQNTATGAAIMEEAVNQRLELIARVYAETFFKPLGRYVLHLLHHWLGEELTLRAGGRVFTWRPADWDPDMDISVAVGLGTGSRTRLVQSYRQVLQIQRELMERLGGASPVRLHHLVYTCHKMAEAAGLEAPERFFGTQEEARRAEAAMLRAQTQKGGDGMAAAAAAQVQLAQRRQALEERKAQEKMRLDRRKAVADAELKAWESAQRIALDQRETDARIRLQSRGSR